MNFRSLETIIKVFIHEITCNLDYFINWLLIKLIWNFQLKLDFVTIIIASEIIKQFN